MKKAIVFGGSRGIGKAIAESLNSLDVEIIATSKQDVDTSNLESVRKFSEKNNNADILVLNTGGPPICLLYTSPSPRDRQKSRMPSSA